MHTVYTNYLWPPSENMCQFLKLPGAPLAGGDMQDLRPNAWLLGFFRVCCKLKGTAACSLSCLQVKSGACMGTAG